MKRLLAILACLAGLNISAAPVNNITFTFNWTNNPSVTKFELLSSTNLSKSFTLFTNLAKATNFTLNIPKNQMLPQQFFKLVAYKNITPISQVNLAWDASIDVQVIGYRIYQGGASGNYTNSYSVGNTTSYTISSLTSDKSYYFAAISYNNLGIESIFSNEVLVNTYANSIETWPMKFTVTR